MLESAFSMVCRTAVTFSWDESAVETMTSFGPPVPWASTTVTPCSFDETAVRIFPIGGGPSHRISVWVPPLKSMPYNSPCCATMLPSPATIRASDGSMNHHFLPRKLHSTFLKSSMGHLLNRVCESSTDPCPQGRTHAGD